MSKNSGECSVQGCTKQAHARTMCPAHVKSWQRKNLDKQRCEFDGCRNHLADNNGRRGINSKYRRLCRAHEYLHLTEHKDPAQSAAMEQDNRERLIRGMTLKGTCWIYDGPAGKDPKGKYPVMLTYLSGDKAWIAHRVAWGLLMGGHGQKQNLDHLCGCEVKAGCVNPAHLEPVSKATNNRREAARHRVQRGEQPHRVKECGPLYNLEALRNPKVIAFAEQYGLPLPYRV